MRRRDLFTGAAATAAIAAIGHRSVASEPAPQRLVWTAFSRHLQWLTTPQFSAASPYETGRLIARTAREVGFEAVDITVRAGGHVDPARVRQRLPDFVRGVRQERIACEQITTDIVFADQPVKADDGASAMPESILEVAQELGILRYRCTPPDYNPAEHGPFGQDLIDQLLVMRQRYESLERLGRRFNQKGLIHPSAYALAPIGRPGTALWDLLISLDGIDPAHVALNCDIGKLVTGAALSAWNVNMRVSQPYWGGMCVKDVIVARKDEGAAVSYVRAGTGWVPWTEFFRLIRQGGYSGVCEVQHEYRVNDITLNQSFWPNGLPPELPPEALLASIRQELSFFQHSAAEAGWADRPA